MDRDLYGILGVPSTASEDEIRHAFRELAKRLHPDVNSGDPAGARKFIEARDAAHTLLDPGRRADYDRSRSRTSPVSPATATRPSPHDSSRETPGPARPAAATPSGEPAAGAGSEPGTFRIIARILVIIVGVSLAISVLVTHPNHRAATGDGGTPNGAVLWKAANYRLDDGWGINLAGYGQRIQIFPGGSADLEVDSGYLSSGGHITFLPPGAAPAYQACLSSLRPASSQAEPLSDITPGAHADLCSSGSTGDIAFIHVTSNKDSGLVMNITIWHDI
jgi:hypothetical protein